jgi:hypothetical protein
MATFNDQSKAIDQDQDTARKIQIADIKNKLLLKFKVYWRGEKKINNIWQII